MKPRTEQPFFCNGCGTQVFHKAGAMMGRTYRCCSIECVRETGLRDARSTVGEPAHVVGCVCEECEGIRHPESRRTSAKTGGSDG